MNGVLFLAARTCRSQAYAQTVAHYDLAPEFLRIFGTRSNGLPGQAQTVNAVTAMHGLFVPDFYESLEKTASDNLWDTKILSTDSVNDNIVRDEIRTLKPRLVIYSGYGGQIVASDILNIGVPFLHIHAGYLPDYRGSTTLYYMWLKEKYCGVTAFLLGDKIDTGKIVARRKYPLPPDGVDPDYVYDSVIRSDLLRHVLAEYSAGNSFRKVVEQTGEGRPYYVIHPVLKHVARIKALMGREHGPNKSRGKKIKGRIK